MHDLETCDYRKDRGRKRVGAQTLLCIGPKLSSKRGAI